MVVPVHDGRRFLPAALASIAAQTLAPLEILVVDDGSTDGSGEIAGGFSGVTLRRQPQSGVASARNAGIAAARGDLIAFLDQDDLWAPEKLEKQVAVMRRRPELGYVLAWETLFLEAGVPQPSWVRPELLAGGHPGYVPGTLLARRDLFDSLGGFDASFENGSDSEWLFRAADRGVPFEVLPVVLLHRRIHDANESRRTERLRPELLRTVKASIDRKRRAAQGSGGQDLP